jgi:hypothetical protein
LSNLLRRNLSVGGSRIWEPETSTSTRSNCTETENLKELKGVSTQSWAEINSFEGEDPKPVPRSLTEEGSVRGRSLQSSSSTRSTKIRTCLTSHGGTCLSNLSQRKLFVVRLRTDRTRIFQSQCSCQRTGNEVLIMF